MRTKGVVADSFLYCPRAIVEEHTSPSNPLSCEIYHQLDVARLESKLSENPYYVLRRAS